MTFSNGGVHSFDSLPTSSSAPPPDDALKLIFAGLKSVEEEARVQAADELGKDFLILIREKSSDDVQKRWEASKELLIQLVSASSSNEKHGGLLAIDRLTTLVEAEDVDPKRNLPKLYNWVKEAFSDADYAVMEYAAKVLGKIIEADCSLFGEQFMDFEVPGSLKLFNAPNKPEVRYGAILVLRKLASCNPVGFRTHAPLVLEKLLVPLRDPRPRIREAVADLLATCLDVLHSQEKQPVDLACLNKILQEIRAGLRSQSNAVEAIHGSLLACRELFKHAGSFMKDFYFDTSQMILQFRNHRDALVRNTVIGLIAVLADYDDRKFVDHILHRTMAHLLDQVAKPTDRSAAFVAIGQVAVSVKSEISTFLKPIMSQIKYGLQQRGKKNSMSDEPIFECLALLATAVGQKLAVYVLELLDLISQSQLTETLVTSMTTITRKIPFLLRPIQIRLLDLISITLCGQIYEPLGAPSQYARPEITDSMHQVYQEKHIEKSPEQIRLALDTLGRFDFSGHTLNEFVRRSAMRYLNDDSRKIRMTAALTTCRLFVRDPICQQVSARSNEIMSEVLRKLLTVAVADPDPEIRRKVLESLDDERFDKHLAETLNVRSLFVVVNDEVFENRIVAVKLIGRLAQYNPGPVMPSLRKALIQIIAELHLAKSIHALEECSQLLKIVIQNTRNLIKPYAVPMFVPLLDRAADPTTTVAANIMDCIGELSVIAAEDAIAYVPSLMKIILAQLAEPIHAKREAALRALGRVCSNTGYVIDPLVDYPELLPTLHGIMKSESSSAIRREVLRVLGILGAIDPYRRRSMLEEGRSAEIISNVVTAVTAPPFNPDSQESTDKYIESVVINSLLDLLKDPLLNHIHYIVVNSVMSIFRVQGLNSQCISYLPQVIPAFIEGTRKARHKNHYLSSLALLVDIVKDHVRQFVRDICVLVMGLWDNVSVQQQQLISLIEALSKAMDAEFKPYLSEILPHMLKTFEGEATSEKKNTQMKVLDAILTFGSNVEEYLHLIIPVIVKAYERGGTIALRKRAVQTIEGIIRRVNVADHASRIIHPLIRALSSTPNAELRSAVMETFCVLLLQLKDEFDIFIPSISKALSKNEISHLKYESLVTKLLNGEDLSEASMESELWRSEATISPNVAGPAKLVIDQQHLKQAWDVSLASTFTGDDWGGWFSRLTLELIKQSPSHALRACSTLVSEHNPLAHTLFNAAFLSCWAQVYERYQVEIETAIKTALESETIPKELAYKILNLTEFMSRSGDPVLGDEAIGRHAMNLKAYAKALHYKELGYFSVDSPSKVSKTLIEELVQINTNLQQHDAAFGLITLASKRSDIEQQEEWFEKLHKWKFALAVYEKRSREDSDDANVIMGTIRCLHALGEWSRLARCVDDYWSKATDDEREEMAGMGAAAAWSLSDWDAMDEYIECMNDVAPDRSFYHAILSVHKGDFTDAEKEIARARDLLSLEFSADIEENQTRTYNVTVRAQMLSELEEIMQYKSSNDQPQRQEAMKRTWMKRLNGCQPEVEDWQRILQVRSLVLQPGEDSHVWIKFADLCRKSDRMILAEKAIDSLIDPSNDRDMFEVPPTVKYAHLKFMWASSGTAEERNDVLAHLRSFTSVLENDLQARTAVIEESNREEFQKLLAKCHCKIGIWKKSLQDHWSPETAIDVLQSLSLATRYDKSWYKAWHTWAMVNFEVAEELGKLDQTENKRYLKLHVRQAVDGYFWSISLHRENPLQDVLRILTLWFSYGSMPEISHVVADGFSKVDIDTWLTVIPQIIARIQTPNPLIRENLNSLLSEIGKHHPQALVFPLSVASKSTSPSRKRVALDLMDRMRNRSVAIVEQALLVEQELIRVAMLWYDLWLEGLEEGSRLYKLDKNPDGMIALFERLHEMIDKGAQSVQESAFIQAFGVHLQRAREHCHQYLTSRDEDVLKKAYDIYVAVYRKLFQHIKTLSPLDLQHVSPELSKARNLELAVPGTYASGRDIVYIRSFVNKVPIYESKQRPRRLTIKGSDGVDYNYILKGHEDLRQDERVMQLFGLVNALLNIDGPSHKRRLQIRQYPVIPIADNVGLIGLVEESDTLNDLIRAYRASRNIKADIEYSLMLRMAPDYESLQPLQKVEVFEYAMANTTGKDFDRSLWDNSASSEHWLERRTTYTRSLAVGSMVGHILGLGDRHPSNLLLERSTGKVVHIDFGDCFEIAMLRREFPEKVPFRLTRMLRRAMEVSETEGTFKNTCEISMRVLRYNQESLMAVLETFVYDPLINWRLEELDNNNRSQIPDTTQADRDYQAQLARDAAGDPQGLNRRQRTNENTIFDEAVSSSGAAEAEEIRSERALAVINRVRQKLTGRDFDPEEELTVKDQVEKLIDQAMNVENLCQHFPGWCSYW